MTSFINRFSGHVVDPQGVWQIGKYFSQLSRVVFTLCSFLKIYILLFDTSIVRWQHVSGSEYRSRQRVWILDFKHDRYSRTGQHTLVYSISCIENIKFFLSAWQAVASGEFSDTAFTRNDKMMTDGRTDKKSMFFLYYTSSNASRLRVWLALNSTNGFAVGEFGSS